MKTCSIKPGLILPPLVTPSDEEPIAASGRLFFSVVERPYSSRKHNLPPPVTPSDEEPIAAGGW